jgi:superfamily II DNA or RNA helicase/uncharacterized tellurite resistance protein B-like protein
MTLMKLEGSADGAPPVGGIVHLPTGAGKTRIGLDFMARTLQREPEHRFVWSTYSLQLIQQTMTRTLEFARAFPKGTQIAWYKGEPTLLENEGIHILFITRQQLADELGWAHDGRSRHPWRARVEDGLPTTLIYDECHQLGAEGLQLQLSKFIQKVLAVRNARKHRWRFVGLSATPVPTRPASHALLQERLFPLRSEQPSVEREWNMHVFHRVTNAELIRERVLCEVNMHMDRSGIFDLPSDLIRRIAKDSRVAEPGPDARKDEVIKYAMRFNKAVMGHEKVLDFLAARLARNLPQLGKTIVFVPDIAAANLLVAKLKELPAMSGKVAAVHSQMGQLGRAVPGQTGRTPEQVLAEFRNRGAEPCILVNVEMLTEGFDDPKVRTIVLAKLTLSTNRFWQMIGRGTRGTRAGGTSDCFVIDPIKLVRLYDYFGGYQPSVSSRAGEAMEDEEEERGPGALDPRVPAISRAPLPSTAPYQVSNELRRTHASVADAIDAFLRGSRLGEDEAIEISRGVHIESVDGGVVAESAGRPQIQETGSVILNETLHRTSLALGADLGWLEKQLPTDLNEAVLRFWLRKLAAIEQLGLRTEHDYARAEMEGRLAATLSTPVVRAEPNSTNATKAPPISTDQTRDAAIVCLAVAHADGEVVAVEIEVATRVLGQTTAAVDNADLRRTLASGPPTRDETQSAAGRLGAIFAEPARRQFLKGLVELAAADGRIHPSEVSVTGDVAVTLGLSRDYAEGLLDFAG